MTSELWKTCLQTLIHPVNLILIAVLAYTAYPLLPSFKFDDLKDPDEDNRNLGDLDIGTSPLVYNWKPTKFPESIVWRTYTPLELRSFDGTDSGRILCAINRLVYDLTSGRSFYGPDGPYGNFAGRDASRGLAKQSFEDSVLTPVDEKIDDLKDLTDSEWKDLREWEEHFKGKYFVCGELIENSERILQPL